MRAGREQYNSHVNKPTLVFHSDWSSAPRKRWCAKATRGSDGRYTASAPDRVGELPSLFGSLRTTVGKSGVVFAGFDFPIGVPEHYAKQADVSRFSEFLRVVGTGDWESFYVVCERPEQVSIHRPFYPFRYEEGCSQQHLLNGHNARSMTSLLRDCELGGNGQTQASSLFWTFGAKAVGKAAIVGWRDVLTPALDDASVRIWPFDGKLETLFQLGQTVIAETYPAECYRWFRGEPLRSKTDAGSRRDFGENLLEWARGSGVNVEPPLAKAIRDGFKEGEDDAFDAVVGLFGMLQIVLGQRGSGEPDDEVVREIEGWILGRGSPDTLSTVRTYSAATDPDLHKWLVWATDSGEASNFIRTVAEAASIADLADYALMRPVLLELKRRNYEIDK